MKKFQFFEGHRSGKIIFLALSLVTVIGFLLVSNNLVNQLADQERERMNIWAKATERIARADMNADVEFLLSIISQNNSIPVMVADSAFNIIEYRNYNLPDKSDKPGTPVQMLSERNRKYLISRLHKPGGNTPLSVMAENNPHFIKVEVFETNQYIYYEDSLVLRSLSLYPYIQLLAMLVIVLVIYYALIYSKKAEQNRVWVGLSKETAHQLGTPISSLMAWTQYLESIGADKEITTEIDKDVKRLSTIADRFSKIGSQPELKPELINETVTSSLGYMSNRISRKVKITMNLADEDHEVKLSRSLFEWVMENMTKNAVDAMDGEGSITIATGTDKDKIFIEIKDTGKGIQRKNFKTVFNPGYTTKKRGWGLGLTLAKRIIEQYHLGRIFVSRSEPGVGTTFAIDIPLSR